MPDYVIIFDRSARHFFEHVATPAEQKAIGGIVSWIATDPYVDFEVKFPFAVPPTVGVLYADGEFWILYEIAGPNEIVVLNIGFEEEVPSPERDPGYP